MEGYHQYMDSEGSQCKVEGYCIISTVEAANANGANETLRGIISTMEGVNAARTVIISTVMSEGCANWR